MIPILLCGGAGSRLWPLPQKKPFFPLFSGGLSLFDMTYKRLALLGDPLIVAGESEKHELEHLGKNLHSKAVPDFLYEPCSQGTSASVALACRFLQEKGLINELVGIFPCDHFIANEKAFHESLKRGMILAEREKQIVTFGVRPLAPLSHYGYIVCFKDQKNPAKKSAKSGHQQPYSKGSQTTDCLQPYSKGSKPLTQSHSKSLDENEAFYRAVGFVEKPPPPQAKDFVKQGCFWNSGIFLSRLDVLIPLFEDKLPIMWQAVLKATKDVGCFSSVWHDLKPLSFDQGIMEKLSQFVCLPLECGWRDLGTWDSVADAGMQEADQLNNKALVTQKDSQGNFVFSSKDKEFRLIGLKNSLVVQSDKGVLVATRGQSGEVGSMGSKMSLPFKLPPLSPAGDIESKTATPKAQDKTVFRPWGSYRVMAQGPGFKIKEIQVRPNARLSLQSHKNHSEHWVVVSGTAEVTQGNKTHHIQAGQPLFISQGQKHRLKNSHQSQNLTLIEVQTGVLLTEDDIIRYEDDYGRT